MKLLDIAWLAGLFEGEGCFRSHNHSPHLTLAMTDRDVVCRAAELMRPRAVHNYIYDKKKKPVYSFGLYGKTAVGWMLTMFSFLGQRRRSAIRAALAQWQPRTRTIVDGSCIRHGVSEVAKYSEGRRVCNACKRDGHHRRKPANWEDKRRRRNP